MHIYTCRPEFERIWRNARLNGSKFEYTESFRMPQTGVFEVHTYTYMHACTHPCVYACVLFDILQNLSDSNVCGTHTHVHTYMCYASAQNHAVGCPKDTYTCIHMHTCTHTHTPV
jgi:hypothetical protein